MFSQNNVFLFTQICNIYSQISHRLLAFFIGLCYYFLGEEKQTEESHMQEILNKSGFICDMDGVPEFIKWMTQK